jgi:hypothetical protein
MLLNKIEFTIKATSCKTKRKEFLWHHSNIFFLHLCAFIAMIDVSGVALSTSSSANIAIKKDIRIIKFWISILQFF